MESIKEQCRAAQEYILSVRRQLHQIPETGIELPETQAFVCAELDKMGIPYQKNTATRDGVTDCGIIAMIEGKNTDKVLAIRADMDALPVTELNDVDFRSRHEGKMHACGHDTHTAMLLGTAKVLMANRHLLNGSVKLLFQAGEEVVQGSRLLMDGGCLENPKVDAILGTHVWPVDPDQYPTGQVLVKSGCMMASGDRFVIHVRGKGVHGSMPHAGIDPIVCAAHVIVALQNIASREVPGEAARVLSVCQVHGGTTWNVVPDEVMLEGTIRTMAVETRNHYIQRVAEIVEGVCKAMRCECTVEWLDGAAPVMNDKDLVDQVVASCTKILGEESITTNMEPSMATEDFANYQEKVPGVFTFLNIANKEKGSTAALHNPRFMVDEDVLWHGTAMQVQTALDFLA